jgi:pullulanase/glycogen debranching enzyme
MMVMGDEVRRPQHGNNNDNAYGQDNEISWFDWSLLAKHADIHRFVRLLNERRVLRNAGPERQHLSLEQVLRTATTAWHGVKLCHPDWSDSSHSLAFSAKEPYEKLRIHVILNSRSRVVSWGRCCDNPASNRRWSFVAEARQLLRANRNRLDAIVTQLLIHETLDEPDVYAAAGIERPPVSSAGAAVQAAAAVRIS